MEEKDLRDMAVQVAQVESRSKSNEKRLDVHDKDIKELREKQDAIYELTASVKSIATDMSYVKDDVKEVKESQKELTSKVTELENKPALDTKRAVDSVKGKVLWLIISGILGLLLGTILPGIPW